MANSQSPTSNNREKGNGMNIKVEKTLDLDEFLKCAELYEQTTGMHWLPTPTETQTLWIASFEQAKKYFDGIAQTG